MATTFDIRVKRDGFEVQRYEILPGDSIVIDGHRCVIVALQNEDSEAWQLQQQKRAREICQTIERVTAPERPRTARVVTIGSGEDGDDVKIVGIFSSQDKAEEFCHANYPGQVWTGDCRRLSIDRWVIDKAVVVGGQ